MFAPEREDTANLRPHASQSMGRAEKFAILLHGVTFNRHDFEAVEYSGYRLEGIGVHGVHGVHRLRDFVLGGGKFLNCQ